jgi:hypothetical protein
MTTTLGHQNRYEELSDSDRHLIDRVCNALASGYTVPCGTPIGTELQLLLGETEKTEEDI